MKKFNFNSRRFKHGSMATIVTAGFIVLVVLVNIITGLLLDRFPTQIDLTDSGMYELSDKSIDYTKGIGSDVDIYVCVEESLLESNQYYKQANEIINNYPKYNSNIKVSYVDVVEDAAFARDYADYGVAEGSVVVESDKRTKVVSIMDLFNKTENSVTSKAEQVMTSALTYVCDSEVLKVSVLTGNSNEESAGFMSILDANNYEVVEQNLLTEDIDPEAQMIVMVAPKIDYTEAQLSKVDAFLDNNAEFGKNLVYIAAYDQPELPNLEAFLKEWGIEMGDGILLETNNTNVYASGQNHIMGLQCTDEEYTADLRDPELPFIGYLTRPLSAVFTEQDNRSTKSILSTYDTAVIMPYDATEDFDMTSQPAAEYNVAMIGSRLKFDQTTPLVSNVLVFSSIDLFSQSILSSASYNNNEYTTNVINKLNGKAESVNISDVSFDYSTLEINASQYFIASTFFVVILPLILVVWGVVVWLRRRNK